MELFYSKNGMFDQKGINSNAISIRAKLKEQDLVS